MRLAVSKKRIVHLDAKLNWSCIFEEYIFIHHCFACHILIRASRTRLEPETSPNSQVTPRLLDIVMLAFIFLIFLKSKTFLFI